MKIDGVKIFEIYADILLQGLLCSTNNQKKALFAFSFRSLKIINILNKIYQDNIEVITSPKLLIEKWALGWSGLIRPKSRPSCNSLTKDKKKEKVFVSLVLVKPMLLFSVYQP